jgi:hypothetical protein
LNCSWDQIEGPEITLNDPNSVNPTVTAPNTISQTNLTFQLIVTNEEGLASEPDQVTDTVSPSSTSPPTEEPQTINDIIKELVKNPLDITNSIQLSKEIHRFAILNRRNLS